MLETTDCSALEDLVAFAEGRLRGEERERVIGHLAECADCREVLAGIVETAEEFDAEDKPAVVTPLPARERRFRWPSRAAAAAAVGAVAVGVVVFSQLKARQHPPSPTEWLAEMPHTTDLAPHVWGGVRMRGTEATNDSILRAAELGALLVDVEVTLRAADVVQTSDALNRMATILEADGTMEHDGTALRAIAKDGDVHRMRTALAKLLPVLDQHLRDRFEPSVLELGTFAEEAQLAASAGDRTFLESRRARKYLDWLIARPQMALPMASSGDTIALPENVQAAVRTLRRDGASSADQATAAKDTLETLSAPSL